MDKETCVTPVIDPLQIDEPRRKSEVSQEQLASLDRYEKATVWPKIAPWIVVVVLVALCVYCCYIGHPWGIVPALTLCGMGMGVLYRRYPQFAKFADKILFWEFGIKRKGT